MGFFNRLTTMGKAVIVFLVVAAIGAVLYFSGATKALGNLSSGGDYDAVIAVNTYAGFAPIVAANGGLEGTTESEMYQKFGVKVKFIVMDDFSACRAGFVDGSVDIVYCTLDALPVEMGASGNMASSNAKYFMLLNHSAGADAVVVDGSVNTVQDLKGKKVAFAEGTASETLLINMLETSGLTMNDIVPVKTESGIESCSSFKSKAVECCVTWSPDDEDAVAAVKGAKVLTSTANCNMLVSDGFVAKKEWLEKNPEKAAKIVQAFLWANSQMMTSEEFRTKAAETFAKEFECDVDYIKASAAKINYSTLSDNINWLGLNSGYSGMNGERIYTKMSRAYTDLQLTKSVIPWSKATYTGIIEKLMEENQLDNNQEASSTADKQFKAPTEQLVTAQAVSTKKVTINFPTAGYTLDNAARSTIDREFVDIIQSFASNRVRVVGNTDNTGNYDNNVALSKKRAQAVVDYLISEYKIDRNRFVVVGDGPKKALAAGVTGESAQYRTTDLELINE